MRLWPFRRREARASIENPAVPLTAENIAALFAGLWAESSAGVKVNLAVALGVPAFWCGVNFLAGTLASLPLNVYRRTRNGGRERADADPLQATLHDAPNDQWTSFRWRTYTMGNILTEGRGLTWIERSEAGRILNLWPLDPRNVSVELRQGRLVYIHAGDPDRRVPAATFEASEIIDLPWMLCPDGVGVHSPIRTLADTLGLSVAMVQYASRFFRNGAVPPLSLEGPFQSPAGAARASKDIHKAIQTAAAEGKKVLALPLGHQLKQIGFNPEEAQLIEGRRLIIEDVARILDVPPVFLHDLTRATFTNAEVQGLHLVKFTLGKWLRLWEQELNLKLFGRRGRTRFVEFNVDGLLRGDFASRMQGYAQAVQNAIRTPNEIRALENLPERPEGDELLIQGATRPLKSQPTEPDVPSPEPDQPPALPPGNQDDDEEDDDNGSA